MSPSPKGFGRVELGSDETPRSRDSDLDAWSIGMEETGLVAQVLELQGPGRHTGAGAALQGLLRVSMYLRKAWWRREERELSMGIEK